jgi:hypothetical protein
VGAGAYWSTRGEERADDGVDSVGEVAEALADVAVALDGDDTAVVDIPLGGGEHTDEGGVVGEHQCGPATGVEEFPQVPPRCASVISERAGRSGRAGWITRMR